MREKVDALTRDAALIALELYNLKEREKELVFKINKIGGMLDAIRDLQQQETRDPKP